MRHNEIIEIIRKCPRSIFFASSHDTFNVTTVSLSAALDEIRVLSADRTVEEIPEVISEASDSEESSESNVSSSENDEQYNHDAANAR